MRLLLLSFSICSVGRFYIYGGIGFCSLLFLSRSICRVDNLVILNVVGMMEFNLFLVKFNEVSWLVFVVELRVVIDVNKFFVIMLLCVDIDCNLFMLFIFRVNCFLRLLLFSRIVFRE